MQESHFFSRPTGRLALVASVFALLGVRALAAKDFSMPTARAAHVYPAHDEHPQEKVTVAVDPYDTGDKAQIFATDFRAYGFLPVFVIVTNDGDQPISLASMKAEFITVKRSKLSAASYDDLMRRMSHPAPKPNQLPIPLPGGKVKGAVNKKTRDEIEQAQFAARAVEPHSTASGFLFFDVSDVASPALPGATFYLTGVRDAGGTELMYFEIPMEKYLSSPTK